MFDESHKLGRQIKVYLNLSPEDVVNEFKAKW